jgi:hypothetical protein
VPQIQNEFDKGDPPFGPWQLAKSEVPAGSLLKTN